VIWGLAVAHVVGSLKGLEELLEDLLLSLLSGNNVWVLVSGVDSTDVVDVDETTTVLVEDVEGLGNDLLSVLVHWSTDGSEELVVLKETTAVDVHVGVEGLDFTLSESKHVISHSLAEFVLVEGH